MRYSAKEIALAETEAKRAAMLAANLLFDIRGDICLGAGYAGEPDDEALDNKAIALEQIEYSADQALEALTVVLKALGARDIDPV